MTNAERWQSITDGLCSPQNMVDWGWRFVVAASIQRRVWLGSEHNKPLYPNMYGVLFAGPGIGKSLVLDTVSDMLKFHKKKDFTMVNTKTSDNEKLLLASVEKANKDDAEEAMIKLKKGGEKIEAVLFPYAPDATTYEALVESMSKSGRRINYNYVNGDGTPKLGIYFHCSMYFCLDELGSLFRKKADSVINYLLGLHSCPLDYEYKTKTNGEDRVRRGCLNFLAGTTPDFMEDIQESKLIGTGFSARTLFICALKNRKNVAMIEPLSPEQEEHKRELLAHIKKLAALYGEVKFEAETKDFIKQWWNDCENSRGVRANKSPKLDVYYARKNIHMYKTAMIEHFSENNYDGIQTTDMVIPLETVKRAIEILNKEELTMHLALTTDSDNPLAKLTKKVLNYIGSKSMPSLLDIITEFWDEAPDGKRSIEEVILHLQQTDRIEYDQEKGHYKKL